MAESSVTAVHNGFKAITVKFMGPTNTRGTRLKAFDGDGNSITVSFDHGLRRDEALCNAAIALCEKMGWKGHLIGGGIKDGDVFVFASR